MLLLLLVVGFVLLDFFLLVVFINLLLNVGFCCYFWLLTRVVGY